MHISMCVRAWINLLPTGTDQLTGHWESEDRIKISAGERRGDAGGRCQGSVWPAKLPLRSLAAAAAAAAAARWAGVRASADAASTFSEKSREEEKKKNIKFLSKKAKKKQGRERGKKPVLFLCTDDNRFTVRSPDSDAHPDPVRAAPISPTSRSALPGGSEHDTQHRVAIQLVRD